MKLSGNTILITGGGTGIGRGLAEAFHALGNQVIIAARRKDVLQKTAAANPGMDFFEFDATSTESTLGLVAQVTAKYPALNVVIANAGMMKPENLLDGKAHASVAEATLNLNLVGPMRLIDDVMPHLKKQPSAAIMAVTSGLGFLPLATTPTYSATKAALHSYLQSLRYQLRQTAIEVIEIVPPYVQTELTGEAQAQDPRAMPLKDFIAEVMALLKANPHAEEICVENVKPLRFAEANGGYGEFFVKFNDMLADLH